VVKVRRNDEDFVKTGERLDEKFYNFHTIYSPLLYPVLIHLRLENERKTI
jgi:hypothetical protein